MPGFQSISTRPELVDLRLNSTKSANGVALQAEKQIDDLVDLLTAERSSSVLQQAKNSDTCELSIVMPCLNEADTIGTCVLEATYAIERMGVIGEVIVADNGSRDDSVEIAESLGARVIHVDETGYGAAVNAGIRAAKSEYIVIGDADNSCDFCQVQRFYTRLKDGADLVQGCRLPSGGGKIMPGAMTWFRQLANPALGWLVRKRFGGHLKDIDCGMRAIRKDVYTQLNPTCNGSEYSIEMIISGIRAGVNMCEVPVRLNAKPEKTRARRLRTAAFVKRVLWMCFSLKF